MIEKLIAHAAQGSADVDLKDRRGLDAVWTLIAIGVMAVLAVLVFAIVPSLQSAGRKMQQALQGAPWCEGPGC